MKRERVEALVGERQALRLALRRSVTSPASWGLGGQPRRAPASISSLWSRPTTSQPPALRQRECDHPGPGGDVEHAHARAVGRSRVTSARRQRGS